MFVRNSAMIAAFAACASAAMPLASTGASSLMWHFFPTNCNNRVLTVCGSGMAMRLRGGSGDRKYCIAGNWKMNPSSLEEAKKLASDVRIDCCPFCVVVCGRVWSCVVVASSVKDPGHFLLSFAGLEWCQALT